MKLKIAGYIFFFLICLISALSYRFPGDIAEAVINQEISRLSSEISLKFQNFSPSFPIGVAADNTIINWQNSPVMQLGACKAFISPFSLVKSSHKATFESHPLGGTVSGSINFKKIGIEDLIVQSDFDSLMLGGMALGPSFFDCKLGGALDGNAEIRIKKGRLDGLTGNFKLAKVTVEFPEPLFGIRQFSFLKGQVAFLPEGKNKVRIKDCIFQGPLMDVDVQGIVQPSIPIEKTSIDLKVKLTLYPLFFMDAGNAAPKNIKKDKDELVFNMKITGRIEKPSIEMEEGRG